jgi:hypothetical protein
VWVHDELPIEILIFTEFHFVSLIYLTDYTRRSKWLGGYIDHMSGRPVYSKETLKSFLESIGFVHIYDEQIPLVIREHRRKYQYIISEATGWRKI